jgi:carboxypeptidase Q
MRRSLTVLTAFLATATAPAGAQSLADRYREPADRIIAAAIADSAAYNRLGRLVDTFGSRISGSESLERAIDWVLAEMKQDGLQNAHTEPVMVPHWVRGNESAHLVLPRRLSLPMLGLGGSVATPKRGITAAVLVVSSFDDLEARAAEARGRIVLFDVPFTTYDSTVRYRWGGASAAAKVGAVAALIRSVTPFSIGTPHTGGMDYDSTSARIPTAALTVEDAKMLHRMQNRGERVVVTLKMEARMLPDVPSRNVMAELVGAERPDEIVVMGGHIDSWDVGQGAMDDGGGLVVAWEAVRLLQGLGLHPRRTIRVVGWTNEERGGRGGRGYRDARGADLDKHVLAIESDAGVFRPLGFDFRGTDSAYAVARQIVPLLAPIQADSLTLGASEADIEPLMERGVPGMGLQVDDTRYFWYHHTQGDTLDKLDPADMARCVAAMAVMAYVVADMPEPLPK